MRSWRRWACRIRGPWDWATEAGRTPRSSRRGLQEQSKRETTVRLAHSEEQMLCVHIHQEGRRQIISPSPEGHRMPGKEWLPSR